MPELPEVETAVRELKKKIIGKIFLSVWTDFKRIIKKPKNFEQFKKEIKGKKIREIYRRGKNIIFKLSDNWSLLIHQKLTGHLLVGRWQKRKGLWLPQIKGPLEDRVNSYIHLIFFLDNGEMIALSDLRKFAKVKLQKTEELKSSKEIKDLGPEPLEKGFNFGKFEEVLRKKRGKIKQVLMDQKVIAGIGNIYSDEILWRAKINPFKLVPDLTKIELKEIYKNIKKVLAQAVNLKGESISDYRTTSGEKGKFDIIRMAYQRDGEKCNRCGNMIKRIKIGGRSAHFCPHCQKLK